MFTLFSLQSGEIVSRAQFVTGDKAARAAKLLSTKTGRRYQVRKAPTEGAVDWRERERGRFSSGEYIPLYPLLAGIAPADHFAHVAKKESAKIAYTQNELKGRADKQSLLTIRSYIDLVAPDYFNEEDRQYLAKNQLIWARDNSMELLFAGPGTDEQTADLIESVYTNYSESARSVANSCMRHSRDNYYSRLDGRRIHPVRAYAGGDLAIAYITNEEGETVARALCWPEKKIYSRVYGEDDALHRMLKDRGYKKSSYYDSGAPSLAGARLARIKLDGNNEVLCPYLDEVGAVSDMEDHLEIGGDLNASQVNGIVSLSIGVLCDHCEDRFDSDDLRTVYTSSRMSSSQQWCENCQDSHGFYCEGEREWFSDNVDSANVGDYTYTLRYLENSDATYCDYTEEWTFDSTHEVIVNNRGTIENWCESAVHDNAQEIDGEYYSNSIEDIGALHQRLTNERSLARLKWERDNETVPPCWAIRFFCESPAYMEYFYQELLGA